MITRESIHASLFGFCFFVNTNNGYYIYSIDEMRKMGFPDMENMDYIEKEQKDFLEKYPNPSLQEPFGKSISGLLNSLKK